MGDNVKIDEKIEKINAECYLLQNKIKYLIKFCEDVGEIYFMPDMLKTKQSLLALQCEIGEIQTLIGQGDDFNPDLASDMVFEKARV